MKYLKTKEGSLEEAISKAMNEKPDSSNELKEARYEIEFSPGEFGQDDADDYADMIQNDLKNDYKIRAKVLNTGRKAMGLTFDTNVPKAKMLKILEDEMGLMVEKKLGIKEATGDKEEYTKFFNAALKKFGVKSPADFKDDAKKKEFFNYVDKNYKGDHEEELDKEDKPTVQKVVKMLKKASKAHADQSKSLEKDLQDDVDKTIDTIQQANDSKRQSMRSILADIWKMNEGKSPFEKDEGFASDAQRRAAFASGYKAKGKKGKKEEIVKSDKTMTGKKPTKVEIEPQVK